RDAPLRHRRSRLQPSFGQISPFERSSVRSAKWKTGTMGSFAAKGDGVDRLAGADVTKACHVLHQSLIHPAIAEWIGLGYA
ncbi:hypothetical protein, partial [Mesorhizobium sp. B2-8-9]|uniref:hypothetical protein n=1 Tax=Mesorhizobium sp. B2-8-9 TaxID=2589899 RepID=UPI001AEDEE8B